MHEISQPVAITPGGFGSEEQGMRSMWLLLRKEEKERQKKAKLLLVTQQGGVQGGVKEAPQPAAAATAPAADTSGPAADSVTVKAHVAARAAGGAGASVLPSPYTPSVTALPTLWASPGAESAPAPGPEN